MNGIGQTSSSTPIVRRTRWRVAFVLVLSLPVVLVGIQLVRRVKPLLFPARSHVTDSQTEDAKRRMPALEEVAWRTKDGLRLRGWFVPGRRKDAVVFVHGLMSNRTQFLAEAERLSQAGHGVLVYDSRASGESEGSLATWGDRERQDVAGALDFLARRDDVDPHRFGVFGCSVGGTAAALVGAADPRLRAVLLGPTWVSLKEELADKFPSLGAVSAWLAITAFRLAGVDVDAVRPVDVVRNIPPRALFMLSGSDDLDTPPAVMQALEAAVPGAERWLIPHAGHCSYIDAAPVEYLQRFADFFDRALAHDS